MHVSLFSWSRGWRSGGVGGELSRQHLHARGDDHGGQHPHQVRSVDDDSDDNDDGGDDGNNTGKSTREDDDELDKYVRVKW